MKNLFWSCAFVASLVILAAAYYVRVQSVRSAVDARAPWVADVLGRFVPEESAAPKVASPPPIAVALAHEEKPVAAEIPKPVATPKVFSMQTLAADRRAWPANLNLKTATSFPALANGKVVGSVTAPVGAEVKLRTISGGMLGVEYQGGGAWVRAEDTDIVARATR